MPDFYVMPMQLYVTAKQLEAQTQLFEQASDDAKASADALCASWEGDSREAFAREQEREFSRFRDLASRMRAYSAGMQKMAEAYEQTDDRAAAMIKSL